MSEYIDPKSLNVYVDKKILTVMPAQFGKTFATIETICTKIENHICTGKNDLHIVHTMNTICNNGQFVSRLSHIKTKYKYDTNAICILSSKKIKSDLFNHVKNIKELKGLFMEKETTPKIIVVCSNPTRFQNIEELVICLNKKENKEINDIYLYYDEIHQYINFSLRTRINNLEKMTIVITIYLYTATPDKIFENDSYWREIPLINLNNINDDNYFGCDECNYIHNDEYFVNYQKPNLTDFDTLAEYTYGYVKHVLVKNLDIVSNGTFSFIPGHTLRKSHYRIRKLIFKINSDAVVIVINGEQKSITYKNHNGSMQEIEIKPSVDKEISETIVDIIIAKSLQNKAIVITGFMCISMGQTLIDKRIGTFTSAIISHLDLNNYVAYQLAGRVNSRAKGWGDKFHKTTIYCPSILKDRIITQHYLAKKLKDLTINTTNSSVTYDNFIQPAQELGEIGQNAAKTFRVLKGSKPLTVFKQSKPVIVINVTQGKLMEIETEIKNTFNQIYQDKIDEQIKSLGYEEKIQQKYPNYDKRYLRVDTDEKVKKWLILKYLEKDALSKPLTIHTEDRNKDILLIYIYIEKDIIIINPWNGTLK